jgi:hypothetical protein
MYVELDFGFDHIVQFINLKLAVVFVYCVCSTVGPCYTTALDIPQL